MEAKHLEIIARFKASLNEGLSYLYECYGKHLYQYSIKNWGLDEDECYELLYQTLETVGKVIDRYEFSSERHFTNWLFKIHKNNTLQTVRTKKSKAQIVFTMTDWEREQLGEEYESNEVDQSFVESVPDQLFDENVIATPLFIALQKALQTTDETERDILMLRMNNYSYEDIANMLGIDNNQLKVKFLRAKAKVQKKTIKILKETSNEKR